MIPGVPGVFLFIAGLAAVYFFTKHQSLANSVAQSKGTATPNVPIGSPTDKTPNLGAFGTSGVPYAGNANFGVEPTTYSAPNNPTGSTSTSGQSPQSSLSTYTPDTSGPGGTDPYATNQAAFGSTGIPTNPAIDYFEPNTGNPTQQPQGTSGKNVGTDTGESIGPPPWQGGSAQ